MSKHINPDRIRVPSPAGGRIRETRLTACEACGASVETNAAEIDHYERDRNPDADGLYQLYEVYRCPNRDCRKDVVEIMWEPTSGKDATSNN